MWGGARLPPDFIEPSKNKDLTAAGSQPYQNQDYIISFRGNDEQKLAKDGAFTSSEGVNVRSWQRRSTVLVTAFLDTTTAQKLSCSDSNGSKGFRAYARSPATRLLLYELLAPASLTLHSAYLDIFETVGQYEVQRFVIAVMRGARSGGVSRRPEGTCLV